VKWMLTALAALAALAPAARAQRTITLEEAVALAQSQSVAVRSAALTIEEREAAVAEARGSFLPAVSLYTNSGQNYGLSFDQTTGEVRQTTTEVLDFGAQAEWTVFDGFQRRADLASARADRAVAERQRERVVQTAVHDVLRAYYEVVVQEAALGVAQENLAAVRTQTELVEATISAGTRPAVERLQQAERAAAAELAVVEADRARRLAGLRLVRLLALDPTEDYRFAPPAAPAADTVAARLDAAGLVARALAGRPDVRAQESAVRAAEADARAARSGAWPSVALVAGYGTSFTSGVEAGLFNQFGDNRGGAVGLRLGFPVFDRGVTRARARGADVRLERLRLEEEDRRREVAVEVREAAVDVELLAEQLRVAERRVRAADAALAAEEERYRLGATTLPVLAELRARRTEAVLGRERARYAVAFQRALLAYRTGELDFTDPLR
jgi:outer membrane protein